MTSIIIDRRASGDRAAANRNRLNRRVRARLKEAVEKAAKNGAIKDLADEERRIRIPAHDLSEPSFRRDLANGSWERVLPGNKHFSTGDEIPKPRDGEGGGGRQGSPDGEGEDDFYFTLSADEFLDILFQGLELPNLRETRHTEMEAEDLKRAGFVKDGAPSRMHIGRTMRAARARRFALRAAKRQELDKLHEERERLAAEIEARQRAGDPAQIERDRLKDLDERIEALQRKIRAIPFIDETDLRFAYLTMQPKPMTNAVMFCIMDVSGSMGENEKELAKRFFLLLYLFLTRRYRQVEMVFIRHHSEAAEVSEETFFTSRESGGTMVSPALRLAGEIMVSRYAPSEWNVYMAQASDGDNYVGDNLAVRETLSDLLPLLRNYFYLEVGSHNYSDLWAMYRAIADTFPNLILAKAIRREDIYPLFRELFSAERATAS